MQLNCHCKWWHKTGCKTKCHLMILPPPDRLMTTCLRIIGWTQIPNLVIKLNTIFDRLIVWINCMHWEMWEMRTHLSCSFLMVNFFCLKTEQIVMEMFIDCLLVKLISNWFHFHCPRIFVVIVPDQVFCPSLVFCPC